MLERILDLILGMKRSKEPLPPPSPYENMDWQLALQQAQYDLTHCFEEGNFAQALPAMEYVARCSSAGLMFVDFYVHDFFLHLALNKEEEKAEKMVQELTGKGYSIWRKPFTEKEFRGILYEALSKEGYLGEQGRIFWFEKLPRSSRFMLRAI